MIVQFRQFIEDEKLCSMDERVLVAVSGGLDSVVLLNLFLQSKFKVIIAHCNFKLRGDESDGDELFVKRLGKEKNIETLTKAFDTRGYAKKMNCSIQEAARDLRYSWFEELCEARGINKIAVGHHNDDQIETFFINLLRGSGFKGLKGMPVKRNKIIRPLMFSNRQQIKNYAIEQNIEFREDSSNVSDKYLRNSIRHSLLPLLDKIKTSSHDSILKSIEYLNEDHHDFQHLLNELRERIIQKENLNKISINEVRTMNASLFYQVLRIYNFNRVVTNNILHGIQNTSSGKIFYSPTHKLLIDREYLFVEEINEEISKTEHLIDEHLAIIQEPVNLSFRKIQIDNTFQINKSSEYAYLDFEKLSFPLKIRKWQKGDRFAPFGMRGSKLVSDYLIDEKLSQFDKENVWLLLSEDKIVWIIGYRISNNFSLKGGAKNCLEIVYKK